MTGLQLLCELSSLEKKAAPDAVAEAVKKTPVTTAGTTTTATNESEEALKKTKNWAQAAWQPFGKADSGLNKFIRGEKLADTNYWKKGWKWLESKGQRGPNANAFRRGIASLARKPGKWGLIGAATLGAGGTLASLLSGDDSSGIGEYLNNIPEEWQTPLMLGAAALPVVGAAAGGLSGDGMLRGAAKGLGAAAGGYAGYQGGRMLANYLSDSDFADNLGDQGKDIMRLASILGGTALGGIGGSSLAGALVPVNK